MTATKDLVRWLHGPHEHEGYGFDSCYRCEAADALVRLKREREAARMWETEYAKLDNERKQLRRERDEARAAGLAALEQQDDMRLAFGEERIRLMKERDEARLDAAKGREVGATFHSAAKERIVELEAQLVTVTKERNEALAEVKRLKELVAFGARELIKYEGDQT